METNLQNQHSSISPQQCSQLWFCLILKKHVLIAVDCDWHRGPQLAEVQKIRARGVPVPKWSRNTATPPPPRARCGRGARTGDYKETLSPALGRAAWPRNSQKLGPHVQACGLRPDPKPSMEKLIRQKVASLPENLLALLGDLKKVR